MDQVDEEVEEVKITKGGALTVGELRKALEGIPDSWELGTGNGGVICWVKKATRVSLIRRGEIVLLSPCTGTARFTEEELDAADIETIVRFYP